MKTAKIKTEKEISILCNQINRDLSSLYEMKERLGYNFASENIAFLELFQKLIFEKTPEEANRNISFNFLKENYNIKLFSQVHVYALKVLSN